MQSQYTSTFSPFSARKVTEGGPGTPGGTEDASMSESSPPPCSFTLSPSSTTDSIPRKRTISRISMDNLPPLPPIEGELMLEVYTHESLNMKPGAITSDEHGGSARLTALGEKVLDSVVMNNLFRRRPMYNASQLRETVADCVSATSVDQWVNAYNLRSKVRCAPGLVTKLKTPAEGRLLFCAYVGALCIQSGYNVVQDWINQLLEPSEKRVKNEPPAFSVPSPLPQNVGAPADIREVSLARIRNQFTGTPTFSQPSPRASLPPPYTGSNNPFSNSSGSLPTKVASPVQAQPPPPTTKPPPLPPTPNQQISFLPLFNQTASQRRLGVEYVPEFHGPPHAGKWHVKCIVNNVEKGQGTGPSKQLAKEEAARQAYYAMGWST